MAVVEGIFTLTNRPPLGMSSIIGKSNTWLTEDLDLMFLVIGDFKNKVYTNLYLDSLRVHTIYSLTLGFFFMPKTDEWHRWDHHLSDSRPISIFQNRTLDPLKDFGKQALGLRGEAFEDIKPGPLGNYFSVPELFRSKKIKDYRGWWGKVKPFSWAGRRDFELEMSIRFPDNRLIKNKTMVPYLFILIGGTPSKKNIGELMYVSGKISYEVY